MNNFQLPKTATSRNKTPKLHDLRVRRTETEKQVYTFFTTNTYMINFIETPGITFLSNSNFL